jgi:hypothetical protein
LSRELLNLVGATVRTDSELPVDYEPGDHVTTKLFIVLRDKRELPVRSLVAGFYTGERSHRTRGASHGFGPLVGHGREAASLLRTTKPPH